MSKISLQWKSIVPAVFFVRTAQRLRQAVDLTIRNASEQVDGSLAVKFGAQEVRVDIREIKPGEGKYRAYLPDIQQPLPVEFILSVGGEVQDRHSLTWVPQRHWQLYLVQHSHVDVGYTNLQSQIMRQHAQYLHEVLRLCRQTDDYPGEAQFRWTCECSWTVENFLGGLSTQKTAKFLRRIREGRIEVTALYLNLTKLLSYEELIRWVYYAAQLNRKYDIGIYTAMNSDVPGFSWALPQVLNGMGVRYFSTAVNQTRAIAPPLPRPFYWQGPDGSRILVWNADPDLAYNEGNKLGLSKDYQTTFKYLPEYLQKIEKDDYPYDALMLRVQDLTIDNSPPGIAISEAAREWNQKWAYPKLIVSTPKPFFEYMEKKYASRFPIHSGDWNDWWPDGAGSTAFETGLNRKTHWSLASAEQWAALASSLNKARTYPKEELDTAYKNMMFFDEHTWGAHGSINYPYSPQTRGQWARKAVFAYEAASAAKELLDEALDGLTKEIRISEKNCLAVFNPLSFERTDVVRVTVPQEMFDGKSAFRIVDVASGEEIAYQQIAKTEEEQELITVSQDSRLRHQMDVNQWKEYQKNSRTIVFAASDVPPFGYRVYKTIPADDQPKFDSPITFGDDWMENHWYRIQFDQVTGGILSLYDKELNLELVDQSGSYRLNQYIYEKPIGGREAIDDQKIETEFNRSSPVSAEIVRGIQGPVMGSMIVKTSGEKCPEIQQEIFLYAHTKKIEIVNTLIKEETLDEEAVYYAFPFDVPDFKVRCEVEGCAMEPEVQQLHGSCRDWYAVQNWVDFSNDRFGVTWAACEAPLVQFSQINTGRWADRLELKHSTLYSWVMNNYWMTAFKASQGGRITFRYAMTSHQGSYDVVQATCFGWGANSSLQARVVGKNLTERLSASSASFCRVDVPNVVLTAFKQAENGQGIILRFREIQGKKTTFRMELPHLHIQRVYVTNIVEENQEELAVESQQIGLTVEAYVVDTIRVMVTASA